MGRREEDGLVYFDCFANSLSMKLSTTMDSSFLDVESAGNQSSSPASLAASVASSKSVGVGVDVASQNDDGETAEQFFQLPRTVREWQRKQKSGLPARSASGAVIGERGADWLTTVRTQTRCKNRLEATLRPAFI